MIKNSTIFFKFMHILVRFIVFRIGYLFLQKLFVFVELNSFYAKAMFMCICICVLITVILIVLLLPEGFTFIKKTSFNFKILFLPIFFIIANYLNIYTFFLPTCASCIGDLNITKPKPTINVTIFEFFKDMSTKDAAKFFGCVAVGVTGVSISSYFILKKLKSSPSRDFSNNNVSEVARCKNYLDNSTTNNTTINGNVTKTYYGDIYNGSVSFTKGGAISCGDSKIPCRSPVLEQFIDSV